MTGWTWDPAVLLALALAGGAYVAGIVALRRRGGATLGPRTVLAYWAGLLVVLVALASPIDAMSHDLFSAHMTQHLIIGLVAPLLLVLGRPLVVMTAAIEPATRRELTRIIRPARRALHLRRSSVGWGLLAVLAHVAAFWVWHAPPVYDAALGNDALHAAEHVTLLATGLLFWWVVLGVRWRARSGVAILYLFVAGLLDGALAALLTIAPRALYTVHAGTTAAWHLTPLEDQQLAGGIMWVPGGLVYAVAAVALFMRWLKAGPATSMGPGPEPAVVWAPPVATEAG